MNWNLILINNHYYIFSDTGISSLKTEYEFVTSGSWDYCETKRIMLSCGTSHRVTDELSYQNQTFNRIVPSKV